MTERSVWAARALVPEGEAARVRVRCREGRIARLETDVEPEPRDDVYEAATLVPGLVDLQVNGALGAGYDAADPAERGRATEFHVRAGTTSLLATLVSAPLEQLEGALRRLRGDARPEGPVLGIHLEGPFLAPERCGAHDPAVLCDPTPERVARLLDAGGEALRLVTLAPERPGALGAIERLAGAGVLVAAGHSRAHLADVRAGIERGLRFATHVGNASDWPGRVYDPGLGYRRSEPGLVGAFMLEPRLRGSLILDGLHLHPGLARALVELRGAENVALVSDATPAVGLEPGRYRVAGLDTVVHPGGFATAGEGLAGGAIPLLEAVRTAVREAGLPLPVAVRMATATPAAALGLEGRKGRLAAGADADLLLLGPDLERLAVYRAGAPVPGTDP